MHPFNKVLVAVVVASAVAAASTPVVSEDSFSPFVNDQGDIRLPHDFRASMVHLGSWFVPTGGASGFHDVYTERATVDAFRKTGKFPDGATLVKELRASDSATYTTGAGVSYATADLKQWFVMIKDAKGRFADDPRWGDGWGWALYKPDDQATNLVGDYETDCLGCHLPVKAKDLVYTEAYPTLSQ